jgi:prephenate dehydrogenase
VSERFGIIGLGHIGGSLLQRLVASEREAVGYDADPQVRERASADGYEILPCIEDVVRQSTHLVLALPTPAVVATVREVATCVDQQSMRPLLISDVASVKGAVFHDVSEIVNGLDGAAYLSLHPMAGREGSGYATADPSLFGERIWIALASPEMTPEIVVRGSELVASCGDGLVLLDLAGHDEVVALISHLPHVISFVYASMVTQNELWPIAARVGAGSFSDMVRVAKSNPGRVREMVLPNAQRVERLLAELEQRFNEARAALLASMTENDRLENLFPVNLSHSLMPEGPVALERVVVLERTELIEALLRYCIEGWSIASIQPLHDQAGYRVVLMGRP